MRLLRKTIVGMVNAVMKMVLRLVMVIFLVLLIVWIVKSIRMLEKKGMVI